MVWGPRILILFAWLSILCIYKTKFSATYLLPLFLFENENIEILLSSIQGIARLEYTSRNKLLSLDPLLMLTNSLIVLQLKI